MPAKERSAFLINCLKNCFSKSRMTQAEAAKVLGVTQARASDLKRGKIDRFSMDLLVRLAARAGLKAKLKLAARDARKSVDVQRRPVAATPVRGHLWGHLRKLRSKMGEKLGT
jgi:predicted XRE-type DNA-binding protein